jgi:hypothetical protein
MAAYTTETLRAETEPDFLVDVVIRCNGALQAVHQQCYWEEAVGHAEAAFARGLGVEIEESDAHDADTPLEGEFDRQH